MICEVLEHVGRNYLGAMGEPFTGHPIARYLRRDAAAGVAEVLADSALVVRGSAGQSKWAALPWIAVLDPLVTTSATRGYYVVYLFAADMQRVYLSLNQGTTAIQKEFGRGALNELARRANLMAARLPERTTVCSDAAISIGAQSTLQKGYEAGHACGLEYDLAALPEEGRLVADLREIVRLYLTLTARGGVDTLPDVSNEDAAGGSITEQRRYRLHRRIERNGSVSSKVKRVRGYICEACGFDFAAIYGELGKGYIEAHHLTPLASLPVGQSVSQDPRTEFAVLCANCHRMVHSSRANPVSVEAIRALPGVRALRSSRGNK